MPARSYHVETLGCPKNQVDSEKLTGRLVADGLIEASEPTDADVVVVNTCAFIDEARQESIDTILALADVRREGSRLVVTGCMAERYGDELAAELPEVDAVVGFGQSLLGPGVIATGAAPPSLSVPVLLRPRVGTAGGELVAGVPDFDLLNLPRPAASAPWAYVKIAEGCDRACGFCAIPSFRGPQRSRTPESILAEVDQLGAQEIVLVAQDLASYGRDQGVGERGLVPLVGAVAERVARVRLLYLYPSDLTDGLIDAICASGVPYFDLSLQHVSRPLMRRMRRWGDGDRFRARIDDIRRREPEAALRSNFIVGYPGETEEDHDALLRFVTDVELDWCGFFSYSDEEGTYAAGLDGAVPAALVAERLAELRETQDAITEHRRADLIGEAVDVLVDAPGVGRSHREAPEIDGIITVPDHLPVGDIVRLTVTGAAGPDLDAD
ncbi:30S ribosomal protein S12 methylthiotransferase RimO [Iamia sp.]|uniref:30S ribosomal protein S12 methylthiotransferase RimO n=1 Tax=Iamia sp. TaxID=2722710 RepID=UPI002CF250D2|nr:30S ribosomal protein S12 methylthiotransferase RimO [Iamia sp.]HXH56931.1 30S ribosomal protein S12 methylthiotransferase RimO [Iamia sp.]